MGGGGGMTGHKGPTKSDRPPMKAEPNGCIFVSGPETEYCSPDRRRWAGKGDLRDTIET